MLPVTVARHFARLRHFTPTLFVRLLYHFARTDLSDIDDFYPIGFLEHPRTLRHLTNFPNCCLNVLNECDSNVKSYCLNNQLYFDFN